MGDSPVQCSNCKGHYTPEDESQEWCPECLEREAHIIPMVRRPESFTWHEVLVKMQSMLKMDDPMLTLQLRIRSSTYSDGGMITVEAPHAIPVESSQVVGTRVLDVSAFLKSTLPEGWEVTP